jgi:hypothetical protein
VNSIYLSTEKEEKEDIIERVSGAMDLYDPDVCNVTQLLPLHQRA